MARVTGEFRLRVMHLPRILQPQSKSGQEREEWAASGRKYYVAIEGPNVGEQMLQGVNQSTNIQRWRIKGRKIPIRDVDRMKDVVSGVIYNVTGVGRADDAPDTLLTVQQAAQQTAEQ